jgi:prephenate dehydrogenase
MIEEVAIIGAGGKMGYWFSKYFNKKGVRVSAYDIDLTSLKPSNNMIICENFSECVETADLVLVCVPVKNTPSAIKKCASKMKSGAILAEISSLKHQSFKTLEKISTDIKPLCIHPMFGPGTIDIKQMKILLVPVKNEENELKILNDIFEGAIITVIPDANIHDELIAIVLGLTHYVNIIFASFLSQENHSYLKEVSGTTFGVQSLLSESILTEEPNLIIDLLMNNPTVRKHIQKYLREANKVARLIFDEDDVKLKAKFVKIRSLLQERQNLEVSYKRKYNIIEKLKALDSL